LKKLERYCFECQEYHKNKYEWCERYTGYRVDDVREVVNFLLENIKDEKVKKLIKKCFEDVYNECGS